MKDRDLPYDLDGLLNDVQAGRTHTYTPFYTNVFSQWHRTGFYEDGVWFPTAEHYMMVGKARLFKDALAEQKILATSSPKEAKAVGRQVQGFDFQAWLKHRYGIVLRGNLKKFAQNPKAMQELAATRGTILVEASPVDRIWGVGLKTDDPRVHDPSKWDGENLLGFVLTEVRATLL